MIHTSEPSCLEEELNRRKVIEHSPRWSCGFMFMHYMQILFEKCMFQWFLFLSVPAFKNKLLIFDLSSFY